MKIKLIITLILLSTLSYGQEERNVIPSKFRPGFMWFFTGFRPATEEKVRKYDRLIFDITYNDWTGDLEPFNNHWASIGLNTNWMFDIPISKGNTVSFGTGITHQWVNIRHDNHLIRQSGTESTSFQLKTPSDGFIKSKYGEHSVLLPIELRFRTKGWKHFKFHIGGKVGYKFNANSKYISNNPFRVRSKTNGFYDESKLVYSAHVRIGIRNWALFGSYQINQMFLSSESTKLNLLQFGLSVSLY